MTLFQRIFQRPEPREALIPLYTAVMAEARQPDWYLSGEVPDTLDGRFDMVALVLALVLYRLEQLGIPGGAPAALLTELFVADMDGQLREMGIDYSVGKQIGKMMQALGGRLTAYRDVREPKNIDALKAALERNLYRGAPPSEAALIFAAQRVHTTDAQIRGLALEALLKGRLA